MESLKVTSPAFTEGGWIPLCHGGYGADYSPALHLSKLDARAVTLAITLDDIDHPLFPNYNHWVAWNLPPVAVLPENLPRGAVVEQPIHIEQGAAYGRHGYRGPKPPFNWLHAYRFTVYALDTRLALGADADKAALLRAMAGHVLQTGVLTGRYQRRRAQ